MNKKELVFQYLDMLFKGSEKTYIPTGGGLLFRITKNGDVIISISVSRKKIGKQIHFSDSEFYFIKNMFGLNEGDTVDYIRDYVSDNIDSEYSNSPFHPYL